MREITATFIGHGSWPELRPDIVQREIMAMAERGIRIFLCGGMGQFDRMCARSVWQQKQNCAQIKSCLVIPSVNTIGRNTQMVVMVDAAMEPAI